MSSKEELEKRGIYYSGRPVEGTIARGDMMPYSLKNDSTGYIQSAGIKSPVGKETINMKEAERLYLVNCGICHGAKLDGNGPYVKMAMVHTQQLPKILWTMI